MVKKSYEVLNDPFLNKGTAFTKEERKVMKNIKQQELKLNILLLLNIKKNILI